MSTGIYAFAHRYATKMTDGSIPAGTDYEAWRKEQWEAGLDEVSDADLRRILAEAGPHFELKATTESVLKSFGSSSELPKILIGLSFLALGMNPRIIQPFAELG